MKEFFVGSLIGAVAGMCIGGIVVSKNKKLSCKINETVDKLDKKLSKAKENIEQKLDDCKDNNASNNACC